MSDLIELAGHVAVSMLTFWLGWHLRGNREAGR